MQEQDPPQCHSGVRRGVGERAVVLLQATAHVCDFRFGGLALVAGRPDAELDMACPYCDVIATFARRCL